MRQLTLKNHSLLLLEEGLDIRVKSDERNVLLAGQNVENVMMIIEENFRIVDSFYLERVANNAKTGFDLDDIHRLSISIVLHYLYMYNSWRLQYKARKYQDLGFKDADFDNPSTNDILFYYYKAKYPDDWEIKCSVLMGLELDDLKKYYEQRLLFYNK